LNGREERIAIIGPLPPLRGGISEFGLRLHRALVGICAPHTFAFSRQYPALLYPGPSDRNPDAEAIDDSGVAYTLDSMNPFTWLATARAALKTRPLALVVQWWTVFWWPAFYIIARFVRRRGTPVILLCHNMVDHEGAAWKRFLSARMMRQADAFVVHSTEHRQQIERQFPGRPIMFAPIPAYHEHPPSSTSLPKRGRLELLFFGFIRPYKGLDVLLDALELLQDEDVYLTVAGEAWNDSERTIARLRRMESEKIELHIEFVSDSSAAALIERADAVVLPYLAASGSAVTALAYNFDTPVIASRIGGLCDAVVEGQTGVLFRAGDAHDLAEAIRNIDRDKLAAMTSSVASYRSQNGWGAYAGKLRDLANCITSDRVRKPPPAKP